MLVHVVLLMQGHGEGCAFTNSALNHFIKLSGYYTPMVKSQIEHSMGKDL